MFCFKVAAKKQIFVLQKKSRDQNLKKKTFLMEFFNEIWLKFEEYEYIYIFEIKFEKKNILFKNGGQNKLWDIAQYAYLC